jgi:rhodanese-related sulfurtransferase
MLFRRGAMGLLAAALLPIGRAMADTGETPPSLEGARTVSPQEAHALTRAGAQVFDVRRRAAYLEGHIPGAQSIVRHYNAATKSFPAEAFGGDKDKVIVIHGHGSDGWSAVYAVRSAVAHGYKNVHWIRGGWREWQQAGLPTAQA